MWLVFSGTQSYWQPVEWNAGLEGAGGAKLEADSVMRCTRTGAAGGFGGNGNSIFGASM